MNAFFSCGGGSADPHYAKCYDASSSTPLNGIRIAFSSQIGTSGIDPALPGPIAVGNVTACLRMKFIV